MKFISTSNAIFDQGSKTETSFCNKKSMNGWIVVIATPQMWVTWKSDKVAHFNFSFASGTSNVFADFTQHLKDTLLSQTT